MNSFYSIVRIAVNTVAMDALGIGLILYQNGNFMVKFSEKKINLVNRFLGGETRKIISHIESQILLKIKTLNHQNNSDKGELFSLPKLIDEKYFNYLSSYSNNILQFSEPKIVKDQVDSYKFRKLFSLLISDEYDEVEALDIKIKDGHAELLHNVEEKLISKVKDKVHTNIHLTSKHIPNLYFKYDLDCIGLNGSFTGAKVLTMDQTITTLHHKTSDYLALTSLLEQYFNRVSPENKFYLIADEPDQSGSPEHDFWKNLSTLPKLKLISSEESSQVTERILDTGAKTFLTESPEQ